MDREAWAMAIGGALLLGGAALLLVFREHASMGILLLVGILLGTSIVSFIVGFTLGHLTRDEPSLGGRAGG